VAAVATTSFVMLSRRPAAVAPAPAIRTYTGQPVRAHSYNLYDLGVVDADQDGILDVYTSNHSAPQSLLLGDGQGAYSDASIAWRLRQNPDFPDYEDPEAQPRPDLPGLYLFRGADGLNVVGHRTGESGPLSGRIEIPEAADVVAHAGFDVHERRGPAERPPTTSVEFRATGDGRLVLRPKTTAVPITVELDATTALERVHVGAGKTRPKSPRFGLQLKDRHALAWADVNGDGALDVYIARGGLQGRLALSPGLVQDELLYGGADGFEDRIDASGIRKESCRGRGAGWLDFDRDGLLDLHVGCAQSPDQLNRAVGNGRFLDVAAALGLARIKSGPAAWLDADADGDLDLLRAEGPGIFLYRNAPAQFQRTRVARRRPLRKPTQPDSDANGDLDVRKLALADYDADGDLDVYAASKRHSRLLINTGRRFVSVEPTTVGLPDVAWTANWVDHDNDGFIDLHTIPSGLYRQVADRRFQAAATLDAGRYEGALDARCAWFDADNDGDRDLLLALQRDAWRWEVGLLRNDGAPTHWLQVELAGRAGNRPAIGARAAVTTQDGVQTQWIGQSEGSHHSQGHYRLYFGLGAHRRIQRLEVTWPDGRSEQHLDVKVDRLLRIHEAPEG
jgi:hypothetical protein